VARNGARLRTRPVRLHAAGVGGGAAVTAVTRRRALCGCSFEATGTPGSVTGGQSKDWLRSSAAGPVRPHAAAVRGRRPRPVLLFRDAGRRCVTRGRCAVAPTKPPARQGRRRGYLLTRLLCRRRARSLRGAPGRAELLLTPSAPRQAGAVLTQAVPQPPLVPEGDGWSWSQGAAVDGGLGVAELAVVGRLTAAPAYSVPVTVETVGCRCRPALKSCVGARCVPGVLPRGRRGWLPAAFP